MRLLRTVDYREMFDSRYIPRMLAAAVAELGPRAAVFHAVLRKFGAGPAPFQSGKHRSIDNLGGSDFLLRSVGLNLDRLSRSQNLGLLDDGGDLLGEQKL